MVKDPRIDEAEEPISTLLRETRLSDSAHDYTLDSEDAEQFLSDCINNDYLLCKHRLETSKERDVLVKGKDSCSGKSVLSFVSEEGHLEIAKLLCEHGAELENFDDDGRTPVMLATLNGRGQTAMHLAGYGASLFIKDRDGTTLIQAAKTAFRQLSEREWSIAKTPIYASEMGSSEAVEQVDSRNHVLQHIKERKEGLKHIIDLYLALKPEKDIQEHATSDVMENDSFRITQRNVLCRPRMSLSKVLFETDMARDTKTFAFLDRGRPFDNIQAAAVSGYTAGAGGANDGCLSRDLWTSRVMNYCEVIGHELPQINQLDRSVPKEFYASHAEKQLMAYFLWMHTTIDQNFRESNDDGEVWGNNNEMRNLHLSKPDVMLLKKDIYVSRDPCTDCKLFQQRLLEKEGIDFKFFFIRPIVVRFGS
ncbi:hypothetical protein ONS95_009030 [Cadophora gregata]|uniref:uncharacterized protein n=1 Tax=Cadophora gregata TaxID=51156 RepID=UPI0026DADBFB|nr:uncharacterized protein ONS95_009030 [Cadophora gregata]KAK0124045.1 hypothetical protein ONS95_009030 [Cadophora gregata]KAK0130378.1 hypothetical protein ONS96_000898 [Cadophora gregata f. sp. sojae]